MNLGGGSRLPRAMIAHPAGERLLTLLGVEIVDECDGELEAVAREWLAMVETTEWGKDAPSTKAVRSALARREAA